MIKNTTFYLGYTRNTGRVERLAGTIANTGGNMTTTIDESAHPGIEDIGDMDLQAHWGCCGRGKFF